MSYKDTVEDWEKDTFYICESCKTRHRFPKFPSEEESYFNGFVCGLTWKDAWESHGKPGGPWMMRDCKISHVGHAAWIKGWDNGHKCKLDGTHPPMLNLPNMSFEKKVLRPRFNVELSRLNQMIDYEQQKLVELIEKRALLKHENSTLASENDSS